VSDRERIAVLGAGAWGTALALALSRAGRDVLLWGRDPVAIRQINEMRRSRHLPGIPLDPPPRATTNLADALAGRGIIVVAMPAQTVAGIAETLAARITEARTLVCCAKGIDRNTGKLPAETVAELLPDWQVAALSGPSFAFDVARDLPTAVTIASPQAEIASGLAEIFSAAQFRCYASTDLKGVELGGALKNVIALAVGVARALQLGASAEAALIARGFAEISRMAVALGARAQTLVGLSGLGDLVLTCSGAQSRNFAYGLALGRGEEVDGLPLAEGAFTARIAARIAVSHEIDAPIISAVADILDRRITPDVAVVQLLERPLKMETS
jgi:glycerol-3-phosphate dehydrogenase (NAD(P)+)